MNLTLTGRLIRGGEAHGKALVSPAPIGFLGGVDPETGVILDPGHPLQGQCIAGKILVFPHGKGSTVGSYTILRLQKAGAAPLAMINGNSEAITAVGAIIADIPMIDQIDISQIHSGDAIHIRDQHIRIHRETSAAPSP